MAGITAQSATKTLAADDTTEDNTVTGFVTKEQIVFGVTGTPASVLWSISKPSASGSACDLDTRTGLTPVLTPDVADYYTIHCLVDGTTSYILRMAIVSTANASTISALRWLPMSNAQIPAPPTGATQFYSTDLDAMAFKYPDDSVEEIALVP